MFKFGLGPGALWSVSIFCVPKDLSGGSIDVMLNLI